MSHAMGRSSEGLSSKKRTAIVLRSAHGIWNLCGVVSVATSALLKASI